MPRLPISDFGGLIPLLDPKRVQEPHVVAGQNFYVDADGPLSGFSRSIVVEDAFQYDDGIMSLRVSQDSETFYLTRDGVYEWCSTTRAFFPRYHQNTPLDGFHPWSFAIVGSKEYYARRGFGLWQRDPVTGAWTEVTGGAVPSGIVACTQSGGRLVVIADGGGTAGLVAWSEIDDGTAFTTSTTTGAGFQTLSMLALEASDQLFTVLEYEKGFIAYTAHGLVRFELINAIIPFRWEVLSRKLKPINPWCVLPFGDYQHVLLDVTGFYITNGMTPELFEPLMSEYFHDQLLPNLDLTLNTIVRIATDADRRWLIVSTAERSLPTIYTRAFVLYLPAAKWGVFSRAHKGFVTVHHDDGSGFFNLGYVDADGAMWEFTDGTIDEVAPVRETQIFVEDWRQARDIPARYVGANAYMTSAIKMTSFPATAWTPAGYWDTRRILEQRTEPTEWTTTEFADATDGTPAYMTSRGKAATRLTRTTVAEAARVEAGLASYVTIGVFRGGRDADVDELTLLHEITISALDGAIGDTFEDYIGDYIDFEFSLDYATVADGAEDEDWGFGSAPYSEYGVTAIGTIDGINQWQDQNKAPSLVYAEGRQRGYSTQVTGLHHLVRIDATEVGETFHLKTMELGLEPAGRLT